MKHRFVNNRPMCFAALALVCAVIVAQAFLLIDNVWVRFAPLAVVIVAFVLLCSFAKGRRFAYVSVFALVGLLAVFGVKDVYQTKNFDRFDGEVSAHVCSEIVLDEGYAKFYVDNVNFDGVKQEGKAFVWCAVGDEVTFASGDDLVFDVASISRREFEPFEGMFSNSLMFDRTMFLVAPSVPEVAGHSGLSALESVNLRVKRMFYENTDEYTASVCQALITGDKFGIDEEFYQDIQTSGLAHLLAVSGLHVSTLAGALYLLLKKCKVKGKIAFFIVTPLMFLYVVFCNFTPSVTRAFVMVSVLAISKYFSQKYDGLSALSFAAIILLVVQPMALNDVGFLLSFGAMLGLMFFANSIERGLDHFNDSLTPKKFRGESKPKFLRKVQHYFATYTSVSIASNLMTEPIAAYFFGRVPTLFLISNLFVVPYVMFAFLVLLVVTAVALVSGIEGIVVIMQWLFAPFRAFVAGIGSIDFASLDVGIPLIFVIGILLAEFVCSPYVLLTKRQKAIGVTGIGAVSGIGYALSTVLLASSAVVAAVGATIGA